MDLPVNGYLFSFSVRVVRYRQPRARLCPWRESGRRPQEAPQKRHAPSAKQGRRRGVTWGAGRGLMLASEEVA